MDTQELKQEQKKLEQEQTKIQKILEERRLMEEQELVIIKDLFISDEITTNKNK